jgi:prophage DNA circulation protein
MANIFDSLYPTSFRGISFLIEGATTKGGRKTVTHEFPNSDRRYVEDLGLMNESISIQASVPSATYFTNRDAIKAALEAKGYGTLVHPFYGIRNVAVKSYTINESSAELGEVKISIEFEVAQELLFPGSTDSSSLIEGQVQALFDNMKSGFFSTYEWVGKYAQNATTILSGLNDITSIINNAASTFITRSEFNDDFTSDYRSKYTTYDNNKASYITTNTDNIVNLYDETRNLVDALDSITNTGAQGFNVGKQLGQFTLSDPANNATTQAQLSRLANQNSLKDMVLVFAFGLVCRNASVYSIKSLDDINLIRIEIDTQYDVLLTKSLSDTVFQNIQDLRANIIRYLDAQGLTAPSIQTVSVSEIPLTVLEYLYYGDLPVYTIETNGDVLSRTEDLRELNRITNQDPTSLDYTVKLYLED